MYYPSIFGDSKSRQIILNNDEKSGGNREGVGLDVNLKKYDE